MSAITPEALQHELPEQYVSRFADHRIGFGKMLRSEWLKMWTLRSTWWMVGATIVLMAGLSLLFAAVMNLVLNDPDIMAQMAENAATGEGIDMTQFAVGIIIVVLGYQFAQLTVAVFAVMTITNEYSSGMIRATFSATPRRLRTLWAKLIMVTLTTAVISVIGLALAWLVSYPLLDRNNMLVDFSDSTQIRSLIGAVLVLVMTAWFALGIGTVLRHTAGGIATVLGLFMVVPSILGIIVMFAPDLAWLSTIYKFLPSEAGQQIVIPSIGMGMGGGATVPSLEPWHGFAVLSAYAVIALAAGALVIKKRDA
ncbi:MAG: hypothetical protein FWD83_04765 [Promicromonosporaceae bacterium]|nr:hypothetical protein [Promicromonosporaceae bacterium]